MAKISELGSITGANTRSEDLFVIVNLIQGDDGTKNITRKELVEAIQYEIFSRIRITGGQISGVTIFDSLIRNVTITDSIMEDSIIRRSTFRDGTLQDSVALRLDIRDSTFTDGEITDSTADNVAITDSTFTDGAIFDSTGNNMIITNSEFNDGTGNNVTLTNSVIDQSLFSNGDIEDSNANNLVITNSTFIDGAIFDSVANNVDISASTFTDGAIFDSTANNVTITQSLFTDGDITDSNANNIVITQSEFLNGNLADSTANNLSIGFSTFTDGTIEYSEILESSFTLGEISDSTATDIIMDNSVIFNSTGNNNIFSESALVNSTVNTSIITQSEFNDGTANNVVFSQGELLNSTGDNLDIDNSDFSNGTGSNNLFTSTTLDDSLITNSTILTTDFREGTISETTLTNTVILDSDMQDSTIETSFFANGTVDDSLVTNARFIEGELEDFEMDLKEVFDPNIHEESWFALKNFQTGKTEKITYKQFYDELAKSVSQALKIHVDVSHGRDEWPGSMLQPVKSLERACELALEKAGGKFDRNDVNNAVHISVGPGTYYTKGNLAIPDDCSATSTSGQYATVIEALPGYENNNCWLVGSGCYLQGFSYTNWKVDNFDFPEGGFAVAYRPGAKLRRSPYLRDSSQLSNFLRADVEPPLNPFNTKGTIADLGRQIILEPGYSGQWLFGDKVTFSSGAVGFLSWDDAADAALEIPVIPGDLVTQRKIYVRNLKNGEGFNVGDTVISESGGVGIVESIGIDDFPNPLVGRGGGCLLADRRVLDKDSLYTYVLCFGFTPRTQNGIGYVARDGAGVNGIGSLSIFTRCAFYALNGGQVTLNNSGSQFGDISMRAKGTATFYQPRQPTGTIFQNTAFGDTLVAESNNIVQDMIDHLTTPISDGGLGYEVYDSQKCERDSGIILDGVGLDIATDSNYWGRLAGITYRSPISYVVINDQQEETAGAIRYLQDRVEAIFQSNDPTINTRANTSFDATLNILENGESYADPLTFADTGVDEQTQAREILQDNKELIIENFVDWIDNNDEFFAYNSKKCRRDTEDYILPAVKYDAQLDTNYNSITAGNAYYMATARKVVEKQREETIGAYKHLKDQTNELIDSLGYLGASRVDAAFDNILDILERTGRQYTATFATYDTVAGTFTITIEDHDLTVGTSILLEEESFVFRCGSDNYIAEISHPRATDPAFNKPLPILSTTQDTITVHVGASTETSDHIYIRSNVNSISVVPNAITFSDDAGISVDRRNARKQLQANKEYIQDHIVGWINDAFFVYDDIKCARDTNLYILPAIERDLALGTNFNSVQAGIAYYQGISTKVINDQLEPTVGAWGYVKNQVAAAISGQPSLTRTDAAADEIIDIINNGLDNVDTIVWSDPASNLEYLTPSTATYDPVTGDSTLTVTNHGLTTDDWVIFAPYSFTFTCDLDGNATQHSYPRVGDANYNTPMQVTSVPTADTFVVNAGVGAGGNHTFVSVTPNAVTKVTTNSQGQYARQTIQANKAFMQQDVISYLNANYFTFDGEKCSRDTGLILDAVKRDIVSGSNYHAVYTGLAYRSGALGTETVITDQLVQTTSAINYLKSEIGAGLSGAELTRSNTAFDEIIDILNNGTGNADPYNFGTNSVSANALNARVILQLNRAFLIAEATAYVAATYPDLEYDVAKCERDTGFLIDAASWDIQHGSNVASGNNAKFYFDHAVSQLGADEVIPTANTFAHLAEIAFQIVRDRLVVPTTGNAEVQDQSQPDLGLTLASQVRNLMNITATAIGDSRDLLVPEAVEPVVETGYSDALVWINGQRARLQDDVIDVHLIPTFNGLPYKQDKCYRDVGLILDAVSKDIEYGGNASTIEAINYYFEGALGVDLKDGEPIINQVNILPLEQRVPTKLAFQHLADIADDIVRNVAVSPQGGNSIVQDTSGNAVNVATGTSVHDLIDTLAVQLAVFENPVTPTLVRPVADPNQTIARQHLQANKAFIQQEVISYLDDRYFTYNNVNCSGDTGTLMDAVKRDVLTGSNFNSIFNGLAYRAGTVSADLVVSDQLTETVGAINYIKQQTALRVEDTTAKARVDAGFNEIIDIMTNGAPSADVIVWGDNALNANRLLGRQKIQANKAFLQKEITAFLEDRYFTYDLAKCERDTGYIIDSTTLDIQLGTNFNSVQAGLAYYNATAASTIANERAQTVAAFRRLSDEIETIGIDAGVAGATVTNSLNASIEVVANIIEDANTAPSLTWSNPGIVAERTYAREQLQINRDFIIAEVIAYITEELPNYDVATCQRDIGYILDAVRRDLILNTTHNTITAGDAYLRTGSAYVLSDQKEYTIAGVERAREQVKALGLATADATIDTLFERVIDVLDGTVTTYTVPSYPLTGSGSYQTTERNTAKNQIQNNRAAIQQSVVDYIGEQFPELVYDVADCFRDSGYILDAVSHDVLYGGNSASIRAADAYFVGAASQLGPEEVAPTIQAFSFLKGKVNEFVTTTPERLRVVELIDIIIDVLAAGTTAGLPAVVEPDLTGLNTADHDAIQTAQTLIEQDVTDYITATYPIYDQAKCERDTGYIIDAISHDLQYAGNRATLAAANIYFEDGINVLPSLQRADTEDAYVHMSSVMQDIVVETVVTPTTGNAETQDVSGNAASATEATTVSELMEIIIDALTAATISEANIPARVEPDLSFVATDIQTWASNTVSATATLKSAVTDFLNRDYDNEVCERDLDYIIDGIRRDLLTGSNYNSVTNGEAYLRSTSEYLLGNQSEATAAVIQYAVDQIKGLGSVTSDATVQSLADIVIDILDGSATTTPAVTYPSNGSATYQTAQRVAASTAIQANKATIISDIQDFIQANYPNIYYDNAKCTRDLGYIIDSVRRDLILGTNHNTVTSANAYLRTSSGYPANGQSTATIAAIEFARDKLTRLPAVESIGEINDLFDRVIDVLNGSVTTFEPSTFPTTEGADYQTDDRVEAVSLIQGNKQQFAIELTTWIADQVAANTSPFTTDFTYDVADCERDTKFILDGISHDIKYGGNSSSRLSAIAYFDNATSQVPGEEAQTIAAFGQLKTIVNQIVTTAPEQTRVNDLIDITINVLIAGSTAGMPAEVDIDVTGLDTTEYDQFTGNQASIISDTITFVNTNYATYDIADCERDTGYILDAISHDVKYGGNIGSRASARAYFDGAVNQLGSAAETTASIGAYTELKTLVRDILVADPIATTTEADECDALIDIIIDVLNDGNLDNLPAEVEIVTTGYTTTEYDDITANQTSIIANSIVYANNNWPNGLGYDAAKCERDVGYLLDCVSFDLQHGGNSATIQDAEMYFTNAYTVNTLPENQRRASERAFAHLAEVTRQVVNAETVTPSPGNPESQIVGVTAGTEAADRSKVLVNITTNVVGAASLSGLPAEEEPDTAAYDAVYVSAFNAIEAIIPTVQKDVITYLAREWNGLGYDQAKCFRDTGYVVDAISHDIQYKGNAATWNAAQIYFVNAVNLLPYDQREPTKLAWMRLAEVVEKVVQLQAVTPTPGNTVAQITTGITGNPLIGERAKELGMYIANIVDDPDDSKLPLRDEPDYDWVASNYTADVDAIEAQAATISTGVIDYIAKNWNGLSYIEKSCRRDVGFIVDAISHDVQYGGNRATRINAQIYFENAISVLPVSTRRQTADTYEYLGLLVRDIVQGIDTQDTQYTTTAQDFTGDNSNSSEGARAQDLVQIIESVIREDNLDVLVSQVEPDLSWVDAELVTLGTTIDNNDTVLADRMIEFINKEFDVLDYDRDKCYRDSGYLLDAFSWDLNYNSNLASRWNADFYFWNNILRLPEEQREPTGRSYRELGEICARALKGELEGQVLNSGFPSEVEVEKVKDLANIFYLTLYNNTPKNLPVKIQPDEAWMGDIYLDAKAALTAKRIDLAKDVVRWVGATYRFVDEYLTRRDAGNLIQAMVNDFKYVNTALATPGGYSGPGYGSSFATLTYSASFFDQEGKIVFPVFNPSDAYPNLIFKGVLENTGALPSTGQRPNWAYIVSTAYAVNHWEGDIYFWDGIGYQNAGANNTDLLDAFTGCWDRMQNYITTNLTPDPDHTLMVNTLISEALKDNILRPDSLVFGSLVESIAHQFNGASAGVNRNALPLNFRNLGSAISALASVQYEDGGRIRWSGSDELNNQYFARGLRINGRTGRIEGRPFTSSVRKLARRASQSRASI